MIEDRILEQLNNIETNLNKVIELLKRNQAQQLEWERKEEAYAPLQFVKFEKLS